MGYVAGIFGLIFVLCGLACGQASNCPEIQISDPSGPVSNGKKANFSVEVGSGEWNSLITYTWSISSGTIRAGQGTRSIEVIDVAAGSTLTATVEIKGLPQGCPDQVSESTAPECKPMITRLDEFTGPLDKVAKERFAVIVEAAKADPNAQLYVIISGGARNPAVSISRKRVVIIDQILNKLGDDSRMTFVHSEKHDDRVVIYLVPAGADNPAID